MTPSIKQTVLTDPLYAAIRLLTEEADSLRDCHTRTPDDWTGEPEAKAQYDHILGVVALLSKLRAPVADERPDEYEHFADWLKKEGPIEREVTKAEMARHGWMAGMRFADFYPLASAPVAGEAQKPVGTLLNQHGEILWHRKPDYFPADFYAAPQASEAVRTTDTEAVLADAQTALASALHLLTKYAPGHHWLPRLGEALEKVKARAALSAQPGAQKEQSDA